MNEHFSWPAAIHFLTVSASEQVSSAVWVTFKSLTSELTSGVPIGLFLALGMCIKLLTLERRNYLDRH